MAPALSPWRQGGPSSWVHYSLLSGVRTALVEEDMAALRMKPDDGAPINARAEAGVVARLGECGLEWCWVTAGGERGWIRKTALWGVKRDEILE